MWEGRDPKGTVYFTVSGKMPKEDEDKRAEGSW